MCGIVGIISTHNRLFLAKVVKQMNELQIHRGPDGQGLWSSKNGNIHFGHRRLAIIDLSKAAHQPMISQDNRYVIVFNGEIYNYKELRKRCIEKGSLFKSNSDTEVIMSYIHNFGFDGIKDFRGMWSFVIYDQIKNTILICRDPFGIKPLYYGIKDNSFYFASEIKSLRCIDPFFSEIDQTTKQFFFDYGYLDVGEWTFFKNVKRFRNACYATINLSKSVNISFKNYWEPPKKTIRINTKDAIKKLDFLLQQSVARHMVSDVPIAFCLSGGLDSSTTVGIASNKAIRGQSLNTFTTHYPDFPHIDESKWAKIVVKHCQTKPHWINPTYEEFVEDFNDVLYHHDEPFVSTSVYAQNSIFKSINKAGIKVSLEGQGADEIFAGYHSYYLFFLKSLLKKRKFITFFYEGVYLILKFNRSLFRSLIHYVMKIKKTQSVHSQDYQERLAFVNNLKKGTFNKYLLGTLLQTRIPSFLRNNDRSSMKSHVEARVPFLDVDVVNFAITLPDNFKIRRAITKYLLRQVAYRYLPKNLVDRKDKLGFPTPEKNWLKKLFNLNTIELGSKEWRALIIKKWELMLEEEKRTSNKFMISTQNK